MNSQPYLIETSQATPPLPATATLAEIKKAIARKDLELKEETLKTRRRASAREMGYLIPVPVAKFLYIGHSEKLASDLLQLPRQVGPVIENFIKQKQISHIGTYLEQRISEIIHDSKQSLKEAVDGFDAEA